MSRQIRDRESNKLNESHGYSATSSKKSFMRKVQSFDCVRWREGQHVPSPSSCGSPTCSPISKKKSLGIEFVVRTGVAKGESTSSCGGGKGEKKRAVVFGSHGHLSSLLCGSPGSPTEHVSNDLGDDGSPVAGGMPKSFSEFSLLQFGEIGSSHRNGLPAPTASLVVEGPSPEAVVNSVRGSWGLGYLSIIALLFVSCANFIMSAVDEHWVEKTGRANAARSASAPLARFGGRFGKRRSKDANSRSKLNAKLGPAAIHSLTEMLGPILPFVGGGDLRRQDAEISLWEVILPESVADSWESQWYTMENPVAATFRRFLGLSDEDETSSGSKNEQSISNVSWWTSAFNRGGGQDSSRGGATVTTQARNKRPSKMPQRDTVLSSPECFIHPGIIAELTLTDITDLFTYAIHVNRPGFDESGFVNGLKPEMTPIIKKMMETVEKSRGKDVSPANTKASPRNGKGKSKLSVGEYGDVDALQFAAAMRIFAEWRVVRQVPEGYKGYAVGMGLGHKDVVQNLVKVETAVFAWIEARKQLAIESDGSDGCKDLTSPTLRDLLVEEVDLNMHAKLPRLKEKSAAMGLLWVRRQLHYQKQIFFNLHSGKYTDTNSAVAAAYKEVYGQFHGWAVQKIFNYSFQAAPPAEEVLKFMNPGYLEQVLQKAKTVKLTAGDEVNEDEEDEDGETAAPSSDGVPAAGGDGGADEGIDEKEDTEENNMNPWERFGNHIGREWDKLGSHIASEWDKLVTNVVRTFAPDRDNDSNENNNSDGGNKTPKTNKGKRVSLEGEALEKYVVEEMTRSAYKEFGLHLEMAEPLLEDLAGLFKELNMDDPTKV